MAAWLTAHENILTLKKESRVRNFFSKTDSKIYDINCIQKVTEIFRQTGKNYTTGLFTSRKSGAILRSVRTKRAMPGKETEMRSPVFAMWFKSEYTQLSLCSYNDQRHVPLSRPYEMLNVISASKQPK